MNYEDNYKQALERAKDMLSYKEVRQEDMEYLFPELKNIEDEQMIEKLKSCVYAADLTIEGRNELITWIEKQHEISDYCKLYE